MTDIKLKIKDILRFNGNIYTVQAEEPINLEERGAVNSVNFTYDNNLTIGETITIHGIDLNDPENSRITTNNGISNWDIGRFTRITRCFVASEENIPLDQSTLYLSNESFENVVFPAIREYIRNHPGEFRLGEGKHENFLPGTARPWWSPEIPGDGTDASPWQDCQPAGEIYPGRPRTYTIENDLCGYHRWINRGNQDILVIDREEVASQRRFLSRLEAQAHAEPINIFTELQELVLLDANAAVETIIQQAERNIKQDNDEREKVSSEEGKKMSDKPEQPVPAEVFSHQKNQLLAQEKELAYQKIAQLLKKYNLETENLAPEWQN
ncbi:15976_t:CDS:2 [Funneliformis geosporum]|uniref:15976_t:CDS:1 n=1 Tax=Funneliformis geosporum TaxID=1117311 RepID=A0A9W4SX54_9GLOM|nr:15976_t:CDS:2 [Funneliformis geosporum]